MVEMGDVDNWHPCCADELQANRVARGANKKRISGCYLLHDSSRLKSWYAFQIVLDDLPVSRLSHISTYSCISKGGFSVEQLRCRRGKI
jgi:hypothetical protein